MVLLFARYRLFLVSSGACFFIDPKKMMGSHIAHHEADIYSICKFGPGYHDSVSPAKFLWTLRRESEGSFETTWLLPYALPSFLWAICLVRENRFVPKLVSSMHSMKQCYDVILSSCLFPAHELNVVWPFVWIWVVARMRELLHHVWNVDMDIRERYLRVNWSVCVWILPISFVEAKGVSNVEAWHHLFKLKSGQFMFRFDFITSHW